MAHQFEKESEKNRDVRVTATSRIWGIAAGMLAICIPLSAVTRSGPILPIAVITGAAVGTRTVWQSSDKKSRYDSLSPHRLEQLEQRIANLETIAAAGDLDLEQRIKQIESSKRQS